MFRERPERRPIQLITRSLPARSRDRVDSPSRTVAPVALEQPAPLNDLLDR